MPQLNLNFTDIPIPETCLWEQFDDQQRQIVIETLIGLVGFGLAALVSLETAKAR